MPNNDREVFEHLTSTEGTSLQIDFLTYAVFASEKREWIKLFESRNAGRSPSQSDIDNWISNLTDSQFTGMRIGAQGFFVEAANSFFEDRLEAERAEILRSAVVREVKSASAWWKQLVMALITAIVAPLILGGLLAAGYFWSLLPSPGDLANRLRPHQVEPVIPTK